MTIQERDRLTSALCLLAELRQLAFYGIKDGSSDYERIGRVATALVVAYDEGPQP